MDQACVIQTGMRHAWIQNATAGRFVAERIQRAGAGVMEVAYVARDDGQPMNQCRCRNQLVQCMLGIWNAEMAPQLDDPAIDAEDMAGITALQGQQPFVQQAALLAVAAKALQFDAAPQFAHCHNGQEQRLAVEFRFFEK